jgi:hypothetical protein
MSAVLEMCSPAHRSSRYLPIWNCLKADGKGDLSHFIYEGNLYNNAVKLHPGYDLVKLDMLATVLAFSLQPFVQTGWSRVAKVYLPAGFDGY